MVSKLQLTEKLSIVKIIEKINELIEKLYNTILNINLNADMTDGCHASSLPSANSIPVTDSYGILTLPYQSSCFIRRATAQLIPNAIDTKVAYNSVIWDVQGEWNNTLYRFVAKQNGIYLVSASLYSAAVAWPVGGTWVLKVFKNGVLYGIGYRWEAQANVTTYANSHVNMLVKLNANEYVEIYVSHTQGTSINVEAVSEMNYLSIIKVA